MKIFHILMKFKMYKNKFVKQLKESGELFKIIDRNYEDRITLNVKTAYYQNLNMTQIRWILGTIMPKDIEVTNTEVSPSLKNSKHRPPSSFSKAAVPKRKRISRSPSEKYGLVAEQILTQHMKKLKMEKIKNKL